MGQRRMPTQYEIVSSRLHCYTQKGFEPNVPLQSWYQEHQRASPLQCGDWEQFRDPRETTYAKYTSLQCEQETFVDGILEWIESTDQDRGLSEDGWRMMSLVVAPM